MSEKRVAMTPGRTSWGHQDWEWIPLSQVKAYKNQGWRVYNPDWENRCDFWNPFWWLEALIRRILG